MKYKYKTPLYFTIIFTMCFTSFAIWSMVTLLAMCNVAPFGHMPVTQGILSIVFCMLFAVVSLFFVTMHYKVTDSKLQLKFGFFDLLNGKVLVDNIVNVVTKGNKLYISYIGQNIDPIIVNINIAAKQFDEFGKYIKLKNELVEVMKDEPADSK